MKRLEFYSLCITIAMCAVTTAQSQGANPATVKSGVVPNHVRFAGLTSAPSAGHRDSAPARPAWTLLFPQTTIPASRFTPSAAYDTPTNSLVLFGGASDSETSNPTIHNDVLSLSNANGNGASDWTTVIPDGASGSPPPRVYPTGVYDAANSRLIIFGGCTVIVDACTTTLNDVWVLSNANGVSGTPTWIQLTPSGSLPSTRWRHAAAYDSANNRMIIYGGDDRFKGFFLGCLGVKQRKWFRGNSCLDSAIPFRWPSDWTGLTFRGL